MGISLSLGLHETVTGLMKLPSLPWLQREMGWGQLSSYHQITIIPFFFLIRFPPVFSKVMQNTSTWILLRSGHLLEVIFFCTLCIFLFILEEEHWLFFSPNMLHLFLHIRLCILRKLSNRPRMWGTGWPPAVTDCVRWYIIIVFCSDILHS